MIRVMVKGSRMTSQEPRLNEVKISITLLAPYSRFRNFPAQHGHRRG